MPLPLYQSPQPILIAENTRTATRAAQCQLCPWAILPGHRCADLADGGGIVHVSCTGTTARPQENR